LVGAEPGSEPVVPARAAGAPEASRDDAAERARACS
jgi:hypothetical protein